MTAHIGTAVFDDGSEEACVYVEHDDGTVDVIRLVHLRLLSDLEKQDLDAHYAVMELAEMFQDRVVRGGLEA